MPICEKPLDDTCKNLDDGLKRIRAESVKAGPGQRAAMMKGAEFMKALCACTTRACYEEVAIKNAQGDRDKCTVTVQNFAVKFERAGPNKWISTHGPEGLCDIVTVQTLENEPKYSVLWTFTEVTPTADTTGPMCKGLVLNTPDRFSYKFTSTFELGCESIDFSTFSAPEP